MVSYLKTNSPVGWRTAGLIFRVLVNTSMPPIIKISAYRAWKGKDGRPRPGCKPYDTDFYTEIDRIANGFYKPIVDQCRAITNAEERNLYKVTQLPSLTISAVCRVWRKLENVINHTGLLNIDIDSKSNPHVTDWGALRDQIFTLPGVVAAFLSVSGRGVTFVVRVNPEEHKDSFFSIVDGVKQHYGINCDNALHDITRLRFVSDDPDTKVRYNFDEIPLSRPSAQYLADKKHYGTSETVLEPIGAVDSEYNFNEAIKRASAGHEFTDGQKWTFLISLAGACNVMGMTLQYACGQVVKHYGDKTTITEEQLLKPVIDVYKLYRKQHGIFDVEARNEQLNIRLKDHLIRDWLHEGRRPSEAEAVEIARTFEANLERVQYCIDRVYSEYGDEKGYNKFPTVQRVQLWLAKRYEFKVNKVTAQPECSLLGSNAYSVANVDEIYRQLQLNRFKYGLENIRSLLRSEYVKRYDPIEEYFRSLTYDPSEDYIERLAGYVTTEEEDWWPKQFKKALVRSIACGLGKKENRIVIVLYGRKQETGKTTFIRHLSPWADGQYYTESPIIGGNVKDTEIRFSENFIYNLEELAGLSRADVNKLKADISKTMIKERRAYAAFETFAPRRCNFWGSTNDKEFLHDDENTRWLVFQVRQIDWNYKTDIDINKVWAQAWNLYINGFDAELDREDRFIREQLNNQYRFRRPEEDLIVRHFKPCAAGVGKYFSATEVALFLNKMYPTANIHGRTVGKTIRATWGLESTVLKINDVPVRGYWLIESWNDAEGEPPRVGWAPARY